MQTARLRGLSEDGRSLIVETDDGEPIAVLADTQLREALRDVRPRPQLEIEMESTMTPREIQMKIRAGASVQELVESSGMPTARVEAFAAPVLAERDHIAGQAQLASVRRRGESAAHRTLRNALAERLAESGTDPEAVGWDSRKLPDNRWAVTASYRVDEAQREAAFAYDPRGRFSVADNDEARWVIGESSGSTAQPTGDPDGDTEPTVKLRDEAEELALIRAVETDQLDPTPASVETPPGDEQDRGEGPAAVPSPPSVTLVEPRDTDASDHPGDTSDHPGDPGDTGDPAPETAADIPEYGNGAPEIGPESQLDLLYDLLGPDGYAEESTRIYDGLTDAAAVPDVGADHGPAGEVDAADQPAASDDTEAGRSEGADPIQEPEPAQDALPYGDTAAEPTQSAEPAAPEPEPVPESEPEQQPEEQPAKKPKKRKRAAVPSWDEIMFGSPKGS